MNFLENHLRRQLDCAHPSFWHQIRTNAVARHLPADRQLELLDVGAGVGILGEYLERVRPQVRYHFVEEIGSFELHLEKRYGPDRNGKVWDTYAGIDAVTVLDVIEHQANDDGFVANLVARMSPGSMLIASVPALMSLWSEWDIALGHYRRYSRSVFAALLAANGLRVVECCYLFPELVAPALGRRLHFRHVAQAGAGEMWKYPELPRSLNQGLYVLGRGSLALRKWWPVGTSVFAVATR